MEIKANLGFVNLDEMDNFNSEEIIDFEEIARIEREELRQKRLRERAREQEEREILMQYQALQFALFSEYEEKKLERQDTNTSLLNNSKIGNESKISNINNLNNDNENNFILSSNLIQLPSLNNKRLNVRYTEEQKNETMPSKKRNNFSTRNNFDSPTTKTENNIKSKSVNKYTIKAKNMDEFSGKKTASSTFYSSHKSLNKFTDKSSMNNQRQNIKPTKLSEKLKIYARNKNVKYKLKQ
jgi:hypothetical protein